MKAVAIFFGAIVAFCFAVAVIQSFGPSKEYVESREKQAKIAEQKARISEQHEEAKVKSIEKNRKPCDGILMWLDGRPISVYRYMGQALYDPKSFSLIGNSKIEFVDGMCVMTCRYRAKNSFGALVLEERTFYMNPDGAILKIEKAE